MLDPGRKMGMVLRRKIFARADALSPQQGAKTRAYRGVFQKRQG
jgi:hypothetical protein